MKKFITLLLALVLVFTLSACAYSTMPTEKGDILSKPDASDIAQSQKDDSSEVDRPSASTQNAQTVTEEKAKQTALEHAKLTADAVKFFEIELDRNKKGVLLYEIEFISGTDKYEYEIGVETGNILSAEKNDINILETTYKKIGEPKAKEIALEHAGVKEGNISRYKIEFDVDDGIPSYEIEFVSGGFEYEYDIASSDGKILKSEKEIYG